MKYTYPQGTKDILPEDIPYWNKVEDTVRECAAAYGFKEIRTPEFEDTALFVRGVGKGTDIVNKEMYTFSRSEKESFTLKPEGTAPVVRSYIQNGMSSLPQPVKLFYVTSCYRAERPQKGRLRQFHQFGAEIFGSHSAYADAQVIMLADTVIRKLGIKNVKLNINSVGCPECRSTYYDALKAFVSDKEPELCEDCHERLKNNPMRILDCKNEHCQQILADAPLMKDYLCDDCREHFSQVRDALTSAGIEFSVNPHIVRGLDYYTNTAFEFLCEDLGSQSAVAAGGRYDGLCETLGGDHVPGVGFGMGIERILMLMDTPEISKDSVKVYFAPLGKAAQRRLFGLYSEMIKQGFSVATDLMDKSLKAQMKYADKLNAEYVYIAGDDELEKGFGILRNMITKEQKEIAFDQLSAYISNL